MKPASIAHHRLSLAGLLITLGIVYGDVGTSPLYVMKAILAGAGGVVTENFILGALSCVFWTITLQTTVKYVLITLRADNKGEGGIFSLYALIRKRARWAFMFAIIGGSTLLADGIITPAITVTSAIEGLNIMNPSIPVLPIVLGIITLLFFIQKFGTSLLGKVFGSSMLVWFSMLLIVGIWQTSAYPAIMKALNPWYAWQLLSAYPGGFIILGAVFLATTGAEALYSDLGHVGLKNIRISWIFVKTSLVMNYFGQGAWILNNPDIATTVNPFYASMPGWFLMPAIIIATLASIIASQALISGSYTIVSEAILLNFWPKLKITYPSANKGQMYISSINWMLYFACVMVILYFRESENMEAAYGLSITITMIMTTLLLAKYLKLRHVPKYLVYLLLAVYLTIEGSFLVSNLQKFIHGGWVTILIAGVLMSVMYIWYKGREIKKRFMQYVKLEPYYPIITELRNDTTVNLYANNLVYITRADRFNEIEYKIIHSLLYKNPKRANMYWFIHVNVLDEPWTLEYSVKTLVPGVITRVEFNIGFKVPPRVNFYFKHVIGELAAGQEFSPVSSHPSLEKYSIPGDFRYVIVDRIQNYDFNFSRFDQFVMDIYNVLKKIGIPDIKAYGLDTSSVTQEFVPLQMDTVRPPLKRVDSNHRAGR